MYNLHRHRSGLWLPDEKPRMHQCDPGTVAYNCARLGLPGPGKKGLVLAMPMWEGAGNKAHDPIGRHHGTLPASGVVWDTSVRGSCLRGDGSAGDYIDTNWRWEIGTGSFAFSCWYKGTESTDWAGLMGAAESQLGIMLSIQSNNFSGWIKNENHVGNIVINDNVWHHCVFIRDGTTGRLYVDGVQDGNDFTVTGDTVDVALNLFIFGWGNNSYNCAGLIDLPLICCCALSSLQVKTLYNNPCGMFEPIRRPAIWSIPLVGAAPTSIFYGPLGGSLAGPI